MLSVISCYQYLSISEIFVLMLCTGKTIVFLLSINKIGWKYNTAAKKLQYLQCHFEHRSIIHAGIHVRIWRNTVSSFHSENTLYFQSIFCCSQSMFYLPNAQGWCSFNLLRYIYNLYSNLWLIRRGFIVQSVIPALVNCQLWAGIKTFSRENWTCISWIRSQAPSPLYYRFLRKNLDCNAITC